MSEDQFTKLFKYMERRFNAIEAQLETKADKSQIDTILSTIDGIISRQDTEETERLAIISQLNRQEDRLERVEGRLTRQGTRLEHVEARLVSIDGRLAKAGL